MIAPSRNRNGISPENLAKMLAAMTKLREQIKASKTRKSPPRPSPESTEP